MATMVQGRSGAIAGESFWRVCAVLIAIVQVAGFSTSIAFGRSSFGAPLYVHVHAFLFFGWVWLFVLQTFLADRAGMKLHRRLGWIAVAWIPAMVIAGVFTVVMGVRHDRVPFFFQPLYFLVMDSTGLFAFAGLAGAAIALRRRTQWHRRLMLCATASLSATGFGRLLPMPLLIPWAGETAICVTLLFPLAGMIRDRLRFGRVHPAWLWGIGVIVGTQMFVEGFTRSAAGAGLYAVVTQESPGAAAAPMAFPPWPKR